MQPALILPVFAAAAFGHQTTVAVGLNQIVGNRAAFRQDKAVIIQQGRFAQGMDGFEFVRGEQSVRMTAVGLQAVGRTEDFKQPNNAQGAGLVKRM